MMLDDLRGKHLTGRAKQWLSQVEDAAADASSADVRADDYGGLTPYADSVSTGFELKEARYLALDLDIEDWDIGAVCDPAVHGEDVAEMQLYMLAHVLLPEFIQRMPQPQQEG